MADDEYEETRDVKTLLDRVLGPMPIYATRIGYRYDSTDYERALGQFLFQIAREWDEFKDAHAATPEEPTA